MSLMAEETRYAFLFVSCVWRAHWGRLVDSGHPTEYPRSQFKR